MTHSKRRFSFPKSYVGVLDSTQEEKLKYRLFGVRREEPGFNAHFVVYRFEEKDYLDEVVHEPHGSNRIPE